MKIPSETSGLLENFLATFIFFIPNWLIVLPQLRDRYWMFLLYNFVMMYLLLSVISHVKFKG